MSRYLIENAKCEVEGGFGPCGSGIVVVEVQVKDDNGASKFYSLADVDGIPNIYITEESSMHIHMGNDEEAFDWLNDFLEPYSSYSEVFEAKDEIGDEYEVYRYLIYLARCEMGSEEAFINETKGKYLDEIEIPMSEIEEEYWEEMEE